MSTIQFECTLSTPTNKPLYKTYRGISETYNALLSDINANVISMLELGIPLRHFDIPKPIEIFHCWILDEELVYTIQCEDSQYNVEFRLSPKHIEQ